MDTRIQRHINNLGRLTGNSGNNKYSYIVNTDDLTNAYLQMRNDCGFPIMVDSKYRRAIVYNKKGLEKKLEKMIIECIYQNMQPLVDLVSTDIVNEVTTLFNSIKQDANGKFVIGSSFVKSRNNKTSIFAKTLAKGLVKGVGNLIDEIMKEEHR